MSSCPSEILGKFDDVSYYAMPGDEVKLRKDQAEAVYAITPCPQRGASIPGEATIWLHFKGGSGDSWPREIEIVTHDYASEDTLGAILMAKPLLLTSSRPLVAPLAPLLLPLLRTRR